MSQSERELREFIYLDDESINGHLSSLQVGPATEQVSSKGNEQETRGLTRAMLSIQGLFGGGAEIEGRDLTSQNRETVRKITVPYRYEILREEIDEEGIEVKDPIEGDSDLSYGDVVKLEGEVSPMSLFRFEIAAEAIELISSETESAMSALDSQEEVNSGNALEATQAFSQFAKNITGERVPLRVDTPQSSFGISLKRDQMRVEKSHAFAQTRRYTIFGRVEQIISKNDVWHPIDVIRLANAFSSGNIGIDELYNSLKQSANEIDITLDDYDLMIDGPTAVIYPFAVYW